MYMHLQSEQFDFKFYYYKRKFIENFLQQNRSKNNFLSSIPLINYLLRVKISLTYYLENLRAQNFDQIS